MRRRQPTPKDTRELVHVPGVGTMTCDAYKAGGAVPTMRAIDALTPEWRKVIHDFGMDAWDYRRYSAAYAREKMSKRA